MYIPDMALGAILLPGALVRFLGTRKQLLGATEPQEFRRSFWGRVLSPRGTKVMLLLTVSSPPGTSSAVPGAMANSWSNRMTHIGAQVW
jgi:hypothetical protein